MAASGRISSGRVADYRPDWTCVWTLELSGRGGEGALSGLTLRFQTLDLEPIGLGSVSTDSIRVYLVDDAGSSV